MTRMSVCLLPCWFLMATVCLSGQEGLSPGAERRGGDDVRIEVLTLGTFHFRFPNRDVAQVAPEDTIDVLDGRYQEEIERVVERLSRFKPTIVVVEAPPRSQDTYDKRYQAYLDGTGVLSRNETEQLGFRLARIAGLKSVHCVDVFGDDYESVKTLLQGDEASRRAFMQFFTRNPDCHRMVDYGEKPVCRSQGLLAELMRLNTEAHIKASLGDYLMGIFKYETPENPLLGADFTSGWWFNRNLRIFRNIQRINACSSDRILVIYGAGHMNLLNLFFDVSPEYRLNRVGAFLEGAQGEQKEDHPSGHEPGAVDADRTREGERSLVVAKCGGSAGSCSAVEPGLECGGPGTADGDGTKFSVERCFYKESASGEGAYFVGQIPVDQVLTVDPEKTGGVELFLQPFQ